MKKKLYGALAICACALMGCQKAEKTTEKTDAAEETMEIVADTAEAVEDTMPKDTVTPLFSASVVYVDLDTILMNYTLAKELNAELVKKQDKAKKSLVAKQDQFQKEYSDYMNKAQNGGFFTQAEVQKAEQSLQQKQLDLQNLDQKLTAEMLKETETMNKRLRDSLNSVLNIYKAQKRYNMIISNTMGNNILYADPQLNITKIVLEDLNSRYKAAGK